MAERRNFEEDMKHMGIAAEKGAKSIRMGFTSTLSVMAEISEQTAGMGFGFEKGLQQALNAAASMSKGLQTLNLTKSMEEITESTGDLANGTASLAIQAGKDIFNGISSCEPLVEGWKALLLALKRLRKKWFCSCFDL